MLVWLHLGVVAHPPPTLPAAAAHVGQVVLGKPLPLFADGQGSEGPL